MGQDINPELFIFVRTIIGMVLGLSIARLLAGLARFVQHPSRDKVYWVHIGWVAHVLLTVVSFWWWEIELVRITDWNFAIYGFLVFYASVFFFLGALLFPDELRDYAGFKDYFYSRRKWFFGILAFTYAIDFIDTAIKGQDYFDWLGSEYPIRNFVMIAACLVAIVVRSEAFHKALVGLVLAGHAVWIWWQYDTPYIG
ncbi:hypothetical protein [Pelagibacterium halotolerans]|uniref:hypothetical protein n=1 Tax=Pelagibacterium halotolerans TaxID=531813 RepID=UPI00384E6987